MKRDWQKLGEVTAIFGTALLVSGLLRYSIQGQMERVSEVLLIAGGVLLLAGLGMAYRGIIKFFSKRSSKLGTNTAILSVAVLGILVVINVLGYQHPKRFDLTTEKFFTLSDQTVKVMKGLTADVNIVRFDKTKDSDVDAVIGEYTALNSHVKYQNVDPEKQPDMARDYGAQNAGDVIVSSGDRKQTVENVSPTSVSESDLTSAIIKVAQTTPKTACFITGHGEKSTADPSQHGYSSVSDALKKEGFDLKDLNLLSASSVPTDCSLVVDAGPTKSFFPQEEQVLSKYLDGGGKALVLVDPATDPKLDDIFSSWNISVGKNFVLDPSRVLMGAGPEYPVVNDYGDSPVTTPLRQQMTFFPLASTVSIADKSKTDIQATELLKTTAAGYTRSSDKNATGAAAKPSTPGVQSLGVAATGKGGAASARLVVIGDSDFASNAFASAAANGDLFDNAVDWLAQMDTQISIRPKAPTERRITMTEGQRTALSWLDIVLLPGIVIISGIGIWWRRR